MVLMLELLSTIFKNYCYIYSCALIGSYSKYLIRNATVFSIKRDKNNSINEI